MDFLKSIKQAIEILKLNKATMGKVAKDQKATTAGILILMLGGIIGGITSKNLVLIFIMPLIALITSFIGIGILHLIAKLFKGEAKFIEIYRVLAHASILNWLSIFNLIPIVKTIIAIIIAIWGIIVNFTAIKNLYKLSTTKTVFVILIPLILLIIIMAIGMAVLLALNPGIISAFQ